jgi:hypothetical protein
LSDLISIAKVCCFPLDEYSKKRKRKYNRMILTRLQNQHQQQANVQFLLSTRFYYYYYFVLVYFENIISKQKKQRFRLEHHLDFIKQEKQFVFLSQIFKWMDFLPIVPYYHLLLHRLHQHLHQIYHQDQHQHY